MSARSKAWRISIAEWQSHGHLLLSQLGGNQRSRIQHGKLIAEACLFRYFASLSPRYRTFGWHRLPRALAGQVAAATANRWFNRWTRSGLLFRFWAAIEQSRGEVRSERPSPTPSPVCRIITLLERAYHHFNRELFRGRLPDNILITVEAHERLKGVFRGGHRVPWIAVMESAFRAGNEAVITVLLHQMVHLWNHLARVPDTGRAEYHNRYFRDAALMAGLECGLGSKGYAYTRLGSTAELAMKNLGQLDDLQWHAR